ncbi:MAG: hypothetical protein V1848_02905 [Candidatus Magasanikbacteria bacterium]
MKKYLFLLFLTLMFTGCGTLPVQNTNTEESRATAEDYEGIWIREASYVNGTDSNAVPATLVMKKDSYISSTRACTVEGPLDMTDTSMTMNISTHNCAGYSPIAITYTYSLSEDKNTFTFETVYGGVEIKEVYNRGDEEDLEVTLEE